MGYPHRCKLNSKPENSGFFFFLRSSSTEDKAPVQNPELFPTTKWKGKKKKENEEGGWTR